jgi:hypothetical protein
MVVLVIYVFGFFVIVRTVIPCDGIHQILASIGVFGSHGGVRYIFACGQLGVAVSVFVAGTKSHANCQNGNKSDVFFHNKKGDF